MEWINVKDRLPEEGVLVVASFSDGSLEAVEFLTLEGMMCITDRHHYPFVLDGPGLTHWIQIPKPPEL